MKALRTHLGLVAGSSCLGVVEVGRHHHHKHHKRGGGDDGEAQTVNVSPDGGGGGGGGGGDGGGGGADDGGGDDGGDVGGVGDSTYVARGTWEGAIPLSTDPNASATGVYTDENLVNWMVAPAVADNTAMDMLVQTAAGHVWKAWIDGDDGKTVYGLSSSGSEQAPLIDNIPSSQDAVRAIDGWVASKGRQNPNFAANKVLVQKPAGGGGELTVHAGLGWLAFIVACAALYYTSKKAGGRR